VNLILLHPSKYEDTHFPLDVELEEKHINPEALKMFELKTHKGNIPLSYAIEIGAEEIAMLLLKYATKLSALSLKSQINSQDEKKKETCFMKALNNGMDSVIDFMLESNELNLPLTDKEGKNCMHFAVINCIPRVVEHCTLWDGERKLLRNATDSKRKDPGDYMLNTTKAQIASKLKNGFDYVREENEEGLRSFLVGKDANQKSRV
jgi:hypothetical protein